MESHSRISRGEVISAIYEKYLLDLNRKQIVLFYRWASEQAKARELGDVVEFARDLQLV